MTSITNRPEILALIPARGGSKGIPKKNIHPVAGKPLIVYTIEAARASEMISRDFLGTFHPGLSQRVRPNLENNPKMVFSCQPSCFAY